MDDDFFDLPNSEKPKTSAKNEATAPASQESSPSNTQRNDQTDYPNPDYVSGLQTTVSPQTSFTQLPSMPYSEEEARHDTYKAGFNDGYYTGYTNAMRDHPSFSMSNDRYSNQSFTFGLVSILTIIIPFISLPTAIAAIVFAFQSRNKGKMPQRSVYGLILGIISAVIFILVLVVAMTYLQTPEGQKFMDDFSKNMYS